MMFAGPLMGELSLCIPQLAGVALEGSLGG